MMKIYFIFLLVVLVLLFAAGILVQIIRNQSRQKKELEAKVESQKKNIDNLVKYASSISNIQNEKSDTEKKIMEAKTDEEISDIVAGIVADNNSRVPDNKDK